LKVTLLPFRSNEPWKALLRQTSVYCQARKFCHKRWAELPIEVSSVALVLKVSAVKDENIVIVGVAGWTLANELRLLAALKILFVLRENDHNVLARIRGAQWPKLRLSPAIAEALVFLVGLGSVDATFD
jgi:hypothetical protein